MQVRVESAGLFHQNYTGLALLWGNGGYVFAGPGLKYPQFEYELFAGDKPLKRRGSECSVANPGRMHQFNWVRIDLRPDTIALYGSADGANWVEDWEVERPEALKGTPALLRLGKSPVGGEAPYQVAPMPAYFDDLIVGRNG